MKILVANLGSTSFKFRLFDMNTGTQIARGGIERIGDSSSSGFVEFGDQQQFEIAVPDHAVAVEQCLKQLTEENAGCLKSIEEVAAIGFKAVHGGRAGGVVRVDASVLSAMEEMNQVAPAHNPPYIAAMRQIGEKLPQIPLIAAFETGFHLTNPARLKHYAVPYEWAEEYGIKRWGFHGASHRYVAQRTARLLGRSDLRVISCHLGGSSSVCAIRNGESVATSMGMSPQSGLPQNNRVGDIDPYVLPVVMDRLGIDLDTALEILSSKSGLLGLSGISGDIRDIREAAHSGNERAQLALEVFVTSIRHYLGAYLVELGGVDVLAFAGGIGENGDDVRHAICADLEAFGIVLDEAANRGTREEAVIHSPASEVEIWIIPTNEELIVAEQTQQLLQQG